MTPRDLSFTDFNAVRAKAQKMLSDFLEMEPARLPQATVALTREADRYFNKEVRFADPLAVPVWRWDGKGLVRGWPGVRTVTAPQAEEYFGVRFARQALTLDPANVPSQKVLLGLAESGAKPGQVPGSSTSSG